MIKKRIDIGEIETLHFNGCQESGCKNWVHGEGEDFECRLTAEFRELQTCIYIDKTLWCREFTK